MRSSRVGLALATAGMLLAAGSARAEYYYTDLVAAAKRGDYHAVHRIVAENSGAVEHVDESAYTALHWAGIRGDWRIFGELVAASAPVNAVGGDGGTPLHWACHHDRADMVRLLLDAGADAHVQNRWGRTALHVAARRGCLAVAELLLDRGANPNATTKEGWSPLHVASMSGHPALVELLKERGADVNARDEAGNLPSDVERARPPAIPIPLSALDDYVGVYDLGGGFTAKVWQEGGRLRLREFAPDVLLPIAADSFSCRQEPWRVSFARNKKGRIDTIEIQFLRRTVTGTRMPSPRYVGSAACMSCHNDPPRANPSLAWMQSRHGHAYWRLGADWALFLARLRPNYQDLERPLEDERCLLCHTTGAQNPEAFFESSYRKEEGVGCEACHGPGSLYMDPEIMTDREAFLANGGIIPDENTCRSCHRNSERFDFEEMWPKVAHKEQASDSRTETN